MESYRFVVRDADLSHIMVKAFFPIEALAGVKLNVSRVNYDKGTYKVTFSSESSSSLKRATRVFRTVVTNMGALVSEGAVE